MKIRTRVAPSPTGDPHVGTAYVALFNMVFAHSQGGQFLVRIEDTDRQRHSSGAEQMILESLHWLGLRWDEGPDVGGPFGPYRQSDRLDVYQRYARQLVASGHAFYCFCSVERLAELRRTQQLAGKTTGYDGLCTTLADAEVSARRSRGDSHVIRLKVPDTGECTVSDLFRGSITIPWSQIDMQVLQKSDGFPTYHLAVVVDDHLMEITHVLRGEEWINSAPKHLLIYTALGWTAPLIGHLPLLRNPDRSKLSKRKNPTSVNYYRDQGYLPEALLNFLAMMGGLMPADADRLSMDDLMQRFDPTKISLGAPVFDVEKLDWLNGQWLRSLSADEFAERLIRWKANRSFLQRTVPLLQERVQRLSQVAPLLDYLLGDIVVDATVLNSGKMDDDVLKKVLQFTEWRLSDLEDWRHQSIFDALQQLSGALGLKTRDFLKPVFVAVGGKAVTLPLFDSMEILGRDICRQRLRSALEIAGGVSKKELKRFESEYRGTQHIGNADVD